MGEVDYYNWLKYQDLLSIDLNKFITRKELEEETQTRLDKAKNHYHGREEGKDDNDATD